MIFGVIVGNSFKILNILNLMQKLKHKIKNSPSGWDVFLVVNFILISRGAFWRFRKFKDESKYLNWFSYCPEKLWFTTFGLVGTKLLTLL